VVYPETVYGDVLFKRGKSHIRLVHTENSARIEVAWGRPFSRTGVNAEIDITIPPLHETLNVVVPWNRKRFQFTSKQHCLPARGSLCIGEREYLFAETDSFACLDYGRGIWPYRTAWNWASCSLSQQGHTLGLNFGGKWTDHTGMTENAVLCDGKLLKLSEDMEFLYNPRDFLAPWTLRTKETRRVDLEFRPFYNLKSRLNLGIVSTRVNQLFGRYFGRVEHDDATVEIDSAVGWAEEHLARW